MGMGNEAMGQWGNGAMKILNVIASFTHCLICLIASLPRATE